MKMTDMVPVKINGQFDIVLPRHRAERPEWFTDQGWEKKRLESMHKHIGKGDCVYYIGAEEGEMPALCAMWGAFVVMFEPNIKVLPNIKAIWAANHLKDVPIYRCFASNKTTDNMLWNQSIGGIDGEVISDHGFKELHEPGDIPQAKIDDVRRYVGGDITALSIDVEGSEFEVLRGAEESLRMYKPKIWLSLHPEFMFRIYGEYQYDLRRWIKDLGYKETILDYQHELHLFYEPIND